LSRAQPEPFAYIVAHALKLVGGACGGFVAQRRRSPSPAQPVHDWFTASHSSGSRFTRIHLPPACAASAWRKASVAAVFGVWDEGKAPLRTAAVQLRL